MTGSIYKFKQEDAFRFARDRHIQTHVRGKYLIFAKCPYCGALTRDKQTFAISLETGVFNCKRATCNVSGNMITLHKDFGFDLGTEVTEYERPGYTWRKFPSTGTVVSKGSAVDYLTRERKIASEIVKQYEITTSNKDDNLIVFPFRDDKGEIVFVKYRRIDNSDGRNKEWCEKGGKPVLYGMRQCDPTIKRLILTEGQIDSLSVATAGYKNAVSVPLGKSGFTWVPHCWDWLHDFKEIVVFGDYENGAMTLLDEVTQRFGDWIDVYHVRPDDYRGCKDANDILRKFGADGIKQCIENAVPAVPDDVEDLLPEASLRDDDDEEKLPTGFDELDHTLYGGLSFGYLDILTGKSGKGKSTFATMLLKSAVEHGYASFIYSGEMTARDIWKTTYRQFAGPRHCYDANAGRLSFPDWRVETEHKPAIQQWLKGRAYRYKSEAFSLEHPANLFRTIERYVNKYGCRFFILDDLMTLIDIVPAEAQERDKFARQEYAVKKLAEMARKYNIIILLVAHKRKSNGFVDTGNDDILGASEVVNLCGAILSYDEPLASDKEAENYENCRRIRITKLRTDGHTDFKGIIALYDESCKRVYGKSKADLDAETMCGRYFEENPPELNFSPVPDDMELPFDFSSADKGEAS